MNDGQYASYGGHEKCTQNFVENTKERDHLEELDRDGSYSDEAAECGLVSTTACSWDQDNEFCVA